jgi:hypothetical protein
MFNHLTNVNQIKQEYRKLALQHHPDRGGDTSTMQRVNALYQKALEQCNGQTSKGSDNKDHTYYYNQEIEQAIMDKIAEILSRKMKGVELELVGTWLWVGGETYQHKDILGKELKMRYSRRHKKWSWHNGPKYSRKSKLSYDEIRTFYGAKSFEAEKENELVLA